MIEKILLYFLEKILNYFKKKYPNGEIAKYVLIEIDKLDATIQQKIEQVGAEANVDDIKSEIINDAKAKMDDIVQIVKNKVEGSK